MDLRLFSKSAGDSNYRIQTLQPFKEWRSDDGWPGALVWAVDLRYGFHNGNSNEYYLDVQTTPGFSNANTKGFVKLVRQPENGGGPNMTLVDSLLTKYIEGPAAKLRERNATQDAFNENKKRESDARARKSRAAME